MLVNNAGMVRRCAAIDVAIDDWDAVVNLNLRSAFLLAQAFARRCLQHGSGGKIINIASLLSFQGGVFVPAYAASKSALMGLTKALANEWAPRGINVNAIAPGYIETELTSALRATKNATPRSSGASRPGAGGGRTKWPVPRCSSRRRHPTTCTGTRWWSTAAGSRAEGKRGTVKLTGARRTPGHFACR